jgi:hypothetical protein
MSEAAMLIMFAIMGGMFLLYTIGLIVHYGRMLKLKDVQIESLQKDLNSAHQKLMTIDFEKFAEMNIRAEAEAMATWREVSRVPEFSDTDIHEPTLQKVKQYGP